MTLIVVGLLCMLFGVTLGCLLGFALAAAFHMPTCVLCGNALAACTCGTQTSARQERGQTNGGK